MDEHLIFYIDFVGFAEAINHWDDTRMVTVIDLLENVATLRAEFDYIEEKTDGGVQYKIRPAISTFSDHIVISYPTENLQKLDVGDPLGVGLIMAQKRI